MKKFYGQLRQDLMKLREITQDKEIKCYALTSDYSLYSINRISKFYLYHNTNEGEQRLTKPLRQIFVEESDIEPYLMFESLKLSRKLDSVYKDIIKLEIAKNRITKGEQQ